MEDLKTSECSCETCIQMCYRPCWGTPDEIQKIIDEGFGNKLMLDYWMDWNNGDIFLLCGAMVGYEGKTAPYWPKGRCAFLTKNNECEVHTIKPFEGRVGSCNSEIKDEWKEIRHKIALEWNSEYGKEIIEKWKNKVGF